jgi:hypothetical protein
MIRFLDTADLHLGNPFGRFPRTCAAGCARPGTADSPLILGVMSAVPELDVLRAWLGREDSKLNY